MLSPTYMPGNSQYFTVDAAEDQKAPSSPAFGDMRSAARRDGSGFSPDTR
ncbi:hypothetical protein [Corynebacterium sp. HMSC074A01]|nr:hypothetical protein [Corynebacterium sp. HMSC074A01]